MADRFEITVTPSKEQGSLLQDVVEEWVGYTSGASYEHAPDGGGFRVWVSSLGDEGALGFLKELRYNRVHALVCVTTPGPGRKKKKKKALKRNPKANASGGAQYKGHEIHVYDRKRKGGYGGFIMLDIPVSPLSLPYMYDSKAAVIAAGKKRVDGIVSGREEHGKKHKLSADQQYKGYTYHTMMDPGGNGWGTGGSRLPYKARADGRVDTVQGWIADGFPSRAAAAKAAKKLIDLVLGGMDYSEAREAVTPKRKGAKKAPARKPAKKKAAKKARRKAAPKPARKKAPARKAKKKAAKRQSQDDRIEALRRKLRRG